MKVSIKKGLVKMGNFSYNQKKLEFAYLFTPPSSMKYKALLTAHFFKRKVSENAALKRKLEKINSALKAASGLKNWIFMLCIPLKSRALKRWEENKNLKQIKVVNVRFCIIGC